jgi:hypothetical protein
VHHRVRRCRSYAGLLNKAYGNRILRMPMAMAALDLYLYWHEAMDGDGGNRWLRTALLDALNKGSVDVR